MADEAHGAARGRARVTVVTEAKPSYDEEFAARRKRYVIMMLMRLPALVLAVVFYRTPWLALLIILASIPLPWMAVLIANDGPARKRQKGRGVVVNDQRSLPGPPREIVDGDSPRAD